MKKIRRLTPEVADQFGHLKEELDDIKSQIEKMSPQLKELLVRGAPGIQIEKKRNQEGEWIRTFIYSPRGAEFQLEKCVYDKINISYKAEFERLFLKYVGNKRRLKKYYANCERTEIESLTAKTNQRVALRRAA